MSRIECKRCGADWPASNEDPDATLADAFQHLWARHGTDDPSLLKESQ